MIDILPSIFNLWSIYCSSGGYTSTYLKLCVDIMGIKSFVYLWETKYFFIYKNFIYSKSRQASIFQLVIQFNITYLWLVAGNRVTFPTPVIGNTLYVNILLL